MDRKKIIVIGSGVALILVLIIYMVSNALKNDNNNEIVSAPTMQGQSNLTADEIMRNEIGTTNQQYNENENQEIVSEEELKNAILSNSNTASSSSSSSPVPNSSYKPYGDRSMYTNEYYEEPVRRKKTKTDIYSDGVEEETVREPKKVEKKKFTMTNGTWRNEEYFETQKNKQNTIANRQDNLEVYKASIISTRQKYLTPDNNRVQIRVLEEFTIKGVTIPRGMQLIAYANFSNELKLEIKSVLVDRKKIPVNISVIDSQGQDAIEIIGGTGAETKDNIEDELVEGTRTGNTIVDKAVNIFRGKKKIKARVSSDYVFLQVNN